MNKWWRILCAALVACALGWALPALADDVGDNPSDVEVQADAIVDGLADADRSLPALSEVTGTHAEAALHGSARDLDASGYYESVMDADVGACAGLISDYTNDALVVDYTVWDSQELMAVLEVRDGDYRPYDPGSTSGRLANPINYEVKTPNCRDERSSYWTRALDVGD